jgi:transcriptional regulator with XRE-family HTH domain
MRAVRERLGYSLEKVGVAIGLDESSSRARISRYELGVHEPPYATARLIAEAPSVPVAYLYCEDDQVAELLLRIYKLAPKERARIVKAMIDQVPAVE